jgi:hypothetical protein
LIGAGKVGGKGADLLKTRRNRGTSKFRKFKSSARSFGSLQKSRKQKLDYCLFYPS